MPDATWKQCERAIAARLGGKRTGPTGRTGPDVEAAWLRVEVKTRRRLPAWLLDALRQARAGSPDARLPLVILHQVGSNHSDDLVLLSLADFEMWFGAVSGPTGEIALGVANDNSVCETRT